MEFVVIIWLHIFQIASSQNDLQMILILPSSVEKDIRPKLPLEVPNWYDSSNTTKFEIVVIEDLSCSYPFSGGSLLPDITKTVSVLYNKNATVIGAAGFLCPQGSDIVAGLIQRDFNKIFQSPFFFFSSPYGKSNIIVHPNIVHMVGPLDFLGKSLVSFLQHQGWLRVSFVTGPSYSRFSFAAQELSKFLTAQSRITIAKYFQVESGRDFGLKGFDARVVLLVMEKKEATRVLCKAHHLGLKWPHYAWIVLSLSYSPLHLDRDSCNFVGLSAELEIDITGVFRVGFESQGNQEKMVVDSTRGSYLADLACDSINIAMFAHIHCHGHVDLACLENWSYVSRRAGNLSYNEHYHTVFSLDVEFTQFRVDKNIKVAYYNSSLFVLDGSIHDNLIHMAKKLGAMLIFSRIIYFITTLVILVLLTASFILFIIFRKEPEVKASSFSLTFLIHLSSYMLVFYLFIVVMEELVIFPSVVNDAICIVRSWFNVLSFQGPLISAITIVKIFRVYRIFHPTKLSRGGKCLSDQLLMLFVMVLQIPNLTITLVWNISDPYLSVSRRILHTNFIEIEHTCESKYLRTWVFLLTSYCVLLGLVLIFVAVKTRKIRKKNFKDTKKVNVFVFLYVYCISLCMGLFLIARAKTNQDFSLAVLHLGSSILIILTITLFFSPKLYPPLRRKFRRKTMSTMNTKASSLHSIVSQYTSHTSLATR